MRKTILLVAAIFVLISSYGCDKKDSSFQPVPDNGNCGFTDCHGLDLKCSTSPPEACTAMYALGDKCREKAHCQMISGECRLVTTPDFDTCKACAQKCTSENSADPEKAFECESSC